MTAGNDYVLSTRVDNWLLGIEASDNTRRNYTHAINAYCAFLSKDPDQLITEAKAEIRDGMSMEERSVFVDIPKFKQHLKKKDLAPNTIRGYIMTVQSFYSYHYIQFPKQRKLKATTLESNIEIPSKSDIQTILKICDPLEKAIILMGISSGLSSDEIRHLKVGNFKDGYDSKTKITALKLRRRKNKVDFVTFLTPEAGQAVIDYLEFRERKSDSTDVRKQKQLQKQHVYSNDDYLFIGRTQPNEWFENKDESLRKFERNSFLKLYRMLNEKARKSTPKGTWNIIRSHNLRKYYNSAMLNAGCDSFFVEFTMGHKVDENKDRYFRSEGGALAKNIFEKFIPYVTIQKELDISESEDFKKIKAEHATLLAEAEKHRIERVELIDLRTQIETERTSKAALKSEIMEELRKEIKKNRQKINEYVDEPEPVMDEPREFFKSVPAGTLQGISGYSLEDLPEKETDLINRILNTEEKKE